MAEKNSSSLPWERQPGEGTKPYEAFCLYRDMGTQRSLSKVAAELQKSGTLIGRWSGAHNWVERAAAWDDEQDKITRKAQLEDIKKMRKRHADLATAMLVKAARALKELPDDEIKASDISRMVETASKLERISRGDVGDVIEERDGGEATPAVQIYIPDNGRNKKDEDFDDLEV